MSDLVAMLRVAERPEPLSALGRVRAFATLMRVPEDVEPLAAAEAPRALPARLASEVTGRLMGALVVDRPAPMEPTAASPVARRRFPMILRLAAAALAVAVPAAAAIVAIERGVEPGRPPVAIGPGFTERLFDPGDPLHRGPADYGAPPTMVVQPPQAPPKQLRPTPKKTVVLGRRLTRGNGPRAVKPQPPKEKTLVDVIVDQVNQLTDTVCDVTSAVLPLCGGRENSLPLLG